MKLIIYSALFIYLKIIMALPSPIDREKLLTLYKGLMILLQNIFLIG